MLHNVKDYMKGFLEFIREQGVMGLAVGFLLGGAVTRVVQALVQDIINPLVGILMGAAGDLAEYKWVVGKAELTWGHFLTVFIDFMIIAAVVYFIIKGFKLDKIDKKKD